MVSLTKDLLRYLPGEVILAILSLMSVPILTRVLSLQQFGNYALVMSSVVIAVRVFGSYPMGIVRFYPAVAEGERDSLVRTSVWIQALSVILIAALFLLLTWILWSDRSALGPLALAGVTIVAFHAVFQVLVEVLRASRRVKAYNVFRIWNKAAGLLLGIVLAVVFELGVFGILWGIVLGFATTLPFLWRCVFAGMRAVGPISKDLARQVGVFGLPLVVGNLAGWVLSQVDRYFIQLYYGAEEVGLYSAAYSISEHSITMLGAFIALSSTPLLTSVWENRGKEASRHLLTSITRAYLIVSIPAVVGLSVLSQPIMIVMTGEEFSAGYSIVPWVVAGAFFLGLQHKFNQVLKLLNRTREIMFWIIFAGIVNIGLNWWLLPLYGYKVAAINTFICYCLLCAGQAWSSRQDFCWPFPWVTTLRCALAASVMFGSILLLQETSDTSPPGMLLIAIPSGVVIYGLSLWAFGEVSVAELKKFSTGRKERVHTIEGYDTVN